MTAPDPPPAAEATAKASRLPKAIVAIALGVVLIVGGFLGTVRYGVLLPQARLLIEARLDGLKIGRLGKLKIAGLGGDVWRDFTVARLTIADEKGVWLDARNIHMTWRYGDLLRRRFHADEILIGQVQLIRRPTLTPKGKDRGLPVSFHIDDLSGRVEMLPGFSDTHGVYDLKGDLDVARRGGQSGHFAAASVLHPGDRLDVRFALGADRPLRLDAEADEAKGGAIAGALGLPPDQRFVLRVHAAGRTSQGRFTAAAVSGTIQPLLAAGSWTPQGGAATGRVLLSASRLTTDLAKRLGPQVAFTIAGRKAGPALFALNAELRSANLTADAKGLGDLGKRRAGPAGVAITLTTADLGKISDWPQTGPVRIDGVLRGDAKAWRYAGSGVVTKASLGDDYVLGRAAGPVEISGKGKVQTLKIGLDGSGGTGRGWIAAVMGAAPRATFEGVRLADGRLLAKSIDVTGVGLKMQGAGDRTLLGALSFRGRAQLSNLAAARVGAGGVISGAWSAAQAADHKPWLFTLDVKGDKFTSGYAELDRLLGPSPGLKAAASIDDAGIINVTEANLSAAAAKVSAAGVLGPAGRLGFKLDWSADGPFRAGPVEITGHAKGAGAVTGDLAAPRADLTADFDAIDVPQVPLKNAHVVLSFAQMPGGANGLFTLAADTSYGPAKAASAFRFAEGGVDLTGIGIDAAGVKAAGSLALRRSAPSAADLTLSVGRGAFLQSGAAAGTVKIVDAAGGARAALDLRADNAVFPGSIVAVRAGRLTANGPMANLPYELKVDGASRRGAWGLNGRGTFAETRPGYAVSFEGSGQAGGRALETLEPTVLRFGGPTQSARLRLATADGGRVTLDGTLADGLAEVRAQVSQLGLTTLDQDLTGKIDATLTLQGRGDVLNGALDAKVQDARGRGTDASTGLDGTLKARLGGGVLTLEAQAVNAIGLKSNGTIELPAESSAKPFRIAINRTKPMRGQFFAEGEVKPLWDLLIGGERSLSGHVRTQGTLSGTLADPRAVGDGAVSGGRFEDGASGLVLTDVAMAATFTNTGIDVTKASGVDGHGGSLSGSGRMSLLREGVSSFRLDLKNFRLVDNDLATASASGQATIDRAADGKVRISGNLDIDRGEITTKTTTPTGVVPMEVVERNRPADLKTALAPPRAEGVVALDVKLKAPRRVFVRGRGLDVELSLDAHVTGTTAAPQLSGVARVVRGDYDFAGKRFEFDSRGVVYLSTRLEAVRLDLTATREDPSLTAVVRIRGTAAKPEITLTSTPVLPNDEVLSQVLFGRSASQLSPLEAAQLASALSAMAGGGGFDVVGNLRAFARLDRLALGGGDATGVTVSGGKYLTEDVYLEITGGGREPPSAQVEWRVGRNLSILSRLAGQRDARLAVRWRRDY